MASYEGLVSSFLLAIFVFQVIELGHSTASTNVSCIVAEREALLKFKHGLTDPLKRLSSWIGEECCKWEGVECDKKTSHVLKLDLHNPCTEEIDFDFFEPSNKCMLGGNIVPSLTELKHMKYLDLSVNNFSTQKIPMFFASLQELEYLNLSYAGFEGDIPRQLNNLSKLLYLDLSNDFGLGLLTLNDLDWLSKLSSLKYLHMSGINLFEVKDWFRSINMLPSLQSLGLRSCGLHNISSSSQANFTSLKFLDVSSNDINSSIWPWIYNLSKLEHIDLSSNYNFRGPFPTAIIENNQMLALFDMSGNMFRGDLPKNLSSLCKLQVVRLGLNNFNGDISDILGGPLGCVQIKWKIFDVSSNNFSGGLPNQFGDFKELEYFDLQGNSISGSIPTRLGELSSLRELYLGYNKLSGAIPESIGRLSNLKELDLGDNKLSGAIPESIGRLSNLKELDLGDNKLSGAIPESIGRLSNLKVLYFDGSLFTGVISELHFENLKSLTWLGISSSQLVLNLSSTWVPPFQAREIYLSNCKVGPEFPKWLRTQRNITVLTMSNVSISDDIPDWFFDISPNIEFLDISSNMLRGQVPQDIGDKMPRLSQLRLWGNNLTGGIPSSLCKLNNLWEIILSKNQLSGRLPRCWGASQRLDVLSFGENKLNGQIPKSLCHLQQLEFLSLRRNGFSGVIPNCLSNLQDMSILDLSDNQFTGRLPPFGKHYRSLRVLNLEKNHLVGGIPPQLCQLSYLRVLSLAENNISGPIPNCFDGFLYMVDYADRSDSWTWVYGLSVTVNTKGTSLIYGYAIKYFFSIDLSANMLDGQIPKEFTRLLELRNLNLSQNNLSGRIPSNIGDLKNLESLDLSRNKLSGSIPPGISSIDFLSHLNLSFNKLSDRIPSGNHLRTVDDESVYRGNDRLCGAPLLKICPGDEPPSTDGGNLSGDKPSERDLDIHNWFYAGLGPGFTVGFLGFCSILHFKRSWRISYFRATDKAIEKFSMTTSIAMLWFKRIFRHGESEAC